jgi:O-antigen/teichoic acid export membrane protein
VGVVLVAVATYTFSIFLLAGFRYSFRQHEVSTPGRSGFARQHIYAVLLAGADLLIIKLTAASADVAIYGVALFLSNIASFALYAINANFTAQISRSMQVHDRGEAQKLLSRVARINIALSLPFVIALVTFSMNLTIFYGEKFEPSELVFLILFSGQIVNVFVGSVALVANVSGYESDISDYIKHSLFLKIIIGAIMSYAFGAIGMAIVAGIANATWNIRAFLLVFNRIGLNTTVVNLRRFD